MTPADIARIRLLGPQKCPPDVQDEYHAAVLAEIAARYRRAVLIYGRDYAEAYFVEAT